MSVGTSGIGVSADVYAAYTATDGTVKNVENSSTSKSRDKENMTSDKAVNEGVVYEKSQEEDKKAPYSINKMSAEDRDALVLKLKADQEERQSQLLDIVRQMMTKQANAAGMAKWGEADDDIWKFLAKGDFTVDAQTKAQAQKDIAEDGYWGVKQTSQRLFDFASALAGDDVEQMKKMQSAMEKGYKQATKAWGRELPEISSKTLEAANQLFEDYYASKASTDTE